MKKSRAQEKFREKFKEQFKEQFKEFLFPQDQENQYVGSTVEPDRTEENKDDVIAVTCRNRHSAGDSKKKNYLIQSKCFETGTTENVLCWYINLGKIWYGLRGGQGNDDFMRLKKTITEGLVISGTGIAAPRGDTKDFLKMTLDQLKGLAFKDFAARHQVNYLRQILCKPVGVTARACARRLQEISNYLEYFPEPDSSVPLSKGNLINILNQMVPVQWKRSMVSIKFQPFTKSIP